MSDTPSYQGASQSTGNGGLLGRFGSFLGGGSTPAYLGEGQPSPGSAGGFLSVATPIYRTAPVTPPVKEKTSTDTASADKPTTQQSTEQTVSVQPVTVQPMIACPIDSDPFGSGPIAIVIPRQG